MKCKRQLLAASLLLAVLIGCSPDSRTFTMHEPGVYKGEKDDLLAKQQRQELIDRFKLVQTDR